MRGSVVDTIWDTPLAADNQTATIIGWLLIAVALLALIRGVFVMLTRVYRNYDMAAGQEELVSTRKGFAAFLYGIDYLVTAALFITCGLSVLRGEVAALIDWALAHQAWLIAGLGVWGAVFGLSKMLGDIACRDPGSFMRGLRQFDRLLGLLFLLLGVAVAYAGLAGMVPSIAVWLPRL